MREIYLKYSDHELFDTMYTPEHFNFILNHMDAFKHMWTKQGKSFWCKYLIMYRHHCYNLGNVRSLIKENVNPFDMPVECIAILADQIFIVLFNEFVNCRFGTAKEFINDLTTLIANKNLVLACRNSSIKKNPFCMSETRDVFRKLLGSCRSYPQGMKDFYLLCLSYPIYGIFGGSIYIALKRWIHAREISIPPETYLQECWEAPPELRSSTFIPQSFHRHMLEKIGDQVDKLLFHGCFGLFSSNRVSPAEDSDFDIKKKGAGSKEPGFSKLFETFVEYVSSRDWYPSDKYLEEELSLDFKDYLRERAEDFEDEEFRRSMILKMAEKKFKEELEKESFDSKDDIQEIKQSSSVDIFKKCTCPPKQNTEQGKKEAPIVLTKNKTETATDTSKNAASSSTAKKDLPSDSLKTKQEASTNTVNSETNNNNSHTKKKKNKKKNKKCLDSESGNAGTTTTNSSNVGVSKTNPKSSVAPEAKPGAAAKNNIEGGGDKSKPKLENCIPKTGKTVQPANQVGTQTKKESSSGNQKSGPVTDVSKKSTELDKIKKNIDTIKQNVQDQKSLSMDGFRLMVETGSLLMSNDSREKPGSSKGNQLTLQTCAQCSKSEDKPKVFKKCSRCKAENVKFVRYYCSRECQAKNWVDCHQEEHEKGLLAKK